MQWLVKSVPSSFSKDLSHEAKAKDSTRKAKAKTKDFKIVLEDSNTVLHTSHHLTAKYVHDSKAHCVSVTILK